MSAPVYPTTTLRSGSQLGRCRDSRFDLSRCLQLVRPWRYECRSASATWRPLGSAKDPTAVQAVADVHDTPFSVLFGAAGVVWIVQLMPFQNSASVPGPPCPTEVQAVAEAHETAESVPLPPGG